MKLFNVQTAKKQLINIIYSVESLYSFRESWLGKGGVNHLIKKVSYVRI